MFRMIVPSRVHDSQGSKQCDSKITSLFRKLRKLIQHNFSYLIGVGIAYLFRRNRSIISESYWWREVPLIFVHVYLYHSYVINVATIPVVLSYYKDNVCNFVTCSVQGRVNIFNSCSGKAENLDHDRLEQIPRFKCFLEKFRNSLSMFHSKNRLPFSAIRWNWGLVNFRLWVFKD